MRMQGTHRLEIRTPEGVAFSFELAGPLSRFGAWVVDLAVVLVALNVSAIVVQAAVALSPGLAMAMILLMYFVISIGYGMLFEWLWNGQTIGKRLLRLRVMDEEGLRLTFPQLAMRNLLRAVDALPALYLLGGIVCTLSPRAQRLGDLAAGTVVVRLAAVGEPDLTAVGPIKYNSFREHGTLAARLRQAISPGAADIALQALMRRQSLRPEARVELFRDLADYLKTLVTFPDEATDGLSDEQYVRNVVDIVYGDASTP